MKRILIVDDNPAIVEATKSMLTLEGYKVEVNTDGSSLSSLQSPLPDLILLDILLPDADGRQLCTQLKLAELTRHIPIVLFSAYARVSDNWQESGADALLVKPFHIPELLDTIRPFLLETEPQGSEASGKRECPEHLPMMQS